jgi:hypothetical protein
MPFLIINGSSYGSSYHQAMAVLIPGAIPMEYQVMAVLATASLSLRAAVIVALPAADHISDAIRFDSGTVQQGC